MILRMVAVAVAVALVVLETSVALAQGMVEAEVKA